MDTGKSALGLDGNLAAALGYPIGIIAIISLIMEKENRFVKFHALQSLLLHVGAAVVFIVLGILMAFIGVLVALISSSLAGIAVVLLWLLMMVAFLAYIAGIIFCAVKAYGGAQFTLPVIGNMAEKFANK